MPMFTTGTPWDQGFSSLSQALFPDPSKIAQAGYYGAEARNKQLQSQQLERQMGGQDELTGIFANMKAPPPQAASPPGPVPPPGQVQSATLPPVPGAAVNYPPPTAAVNPTALATQLSSGAPPPEASPGGGAPPAPTATGSDGSVPPNDPQSGMFHPGSITPPGGGVKMSGPAQANGSPAPPFDIAAVMNAAVRAGYDGPKLQAIAGAAIAKAVQIGSLDEPTARKMLIDLNPSEMGAMMRQQIVTGSALVPVWDNQTNRPTEITHDQYVRDGGQRFRGISEASSNAWEAPGRFYNPKNPAASITAPMWAGAGQGGVQVTANGPAEATGGIIASGAPPTRKQVETISGATVLSTPPEALDPQKQAQNRQIDEQVVNKMFPPTGNVRDANMPVVLDDPTQAVATRADELQRTTLAFRNNRAAAYTQALQEMQQQGRVGPVNRGTTFAGRNLPGAVTGQVGANPDVVNVTVQTAKGPVKQPRLRVRILPPGQQIKNNAGQVAPQAGPQAAPPAGPQVAPAEASAPPQVSQIFGIPTGPGAGGGKPYTSAFQPKNPTPFHMPQAAASDPYAPGGALAGVPQKKGGPAKPYKGSPFVNQPAAPARVAAPPPSRGTQPMPQAPAAPPPQAAPQQQAQQGMPTRAPEGAIIQSKTTGQYMIVRGGLAYPVTPQQIQAMQAGQQ